MVGFQPKALRGCALPEPRMHRGPGGTASFPPSGSRTRWEKLRGCGSRKGLPASLQLRLRPPLDPPYVSIKIYSKPSESPSDSMSCNFACNFVYLLIVIKHVKVSEIAGSSHARSSFIRLYLDSDLGALAPGLRSGLSRDPRRGWLTCFMGGGHGQAGAWWQRCPLERQKAWRWEERALPGRDPGASDLEACLHAWGTEGPSPGSGREAWREAGVAVSGKFLPSLPHFCWGHLLSLSVLEWCKPIRLNWVKRNMLWPVSPRRFRKTCMTELSWSVNLCLFRRWRVDRQDVFLNGEVYHVYRNVHAAFTDKAKVIIKWTPTYYKVSKVVYIIIYVVMNITIIIYIPKFGTRTPRTLEALRSAWARLQRPQRQSPSWHLRSSSHCFFFSLCITWCYCLLLNFIQME